MVDGFDLSGCFFLIHFLWVCLGLLYFLGSRKCALSTLRQLAQLKLLKLCLREFLPLGVYPFLMFLSEVLLGMTSNLDAGSGLYNLLDVHPVSAVELHARQKALMLLIRPSLTGVFHIKYI